MLNSDTMKDDASKVNYEKPVIIPIYPGEMNTYMAFPRDSNYRTNIDEIPIDDLCKNFGSPLFVFSEKAIREKFRETKAIFSEEYPNIQFCWSYKTNYLGAICNIFHQEGCIAEVVSEMEYQKARELGVEGKDIIFNGPLKSKKILKQAIEESAKIHIDHLDELYDLIDLSKEMNKKIDVAIRLNLDSGVSYNWDRFGFNLESGQAMRIVELINDSNLNLTGLHCHICTFVLDTNAYKHQIEKMIQFAYQIEDRLGIKIEYLDIGGGFPSKSNLKPAYSLANKTAPSIKSFAKKIGKALSDNLRPSHKPMIYIETGRMLIDEAGFLITTVKAKKRLANARKAYVMDAGVNLLYTSTWYKFNIETSKKITAPHEYSTLYGPLCMNIDVVDDHVALPPLSKEDKLIFSPVGAYNVTQWMQFIQYRPNIVLITDNGNVEIIRKKEDLSNLHDCEEIPDHLTKI